jgi:hypothetical protein
VSTYAEIKFIHEILRQMPKVQTKEQYNQYLEVFKQKGWPNLFEIDFIVWDSLSSVFEQINKKALDVRNQQQGWGSFAVEVRDFIDELKDYKHMVFSIGLSEIADNGKEYMKVRGNASAKGEIEKLFMQVGFTAPEWWEDGKYKDMLKRAWYTFVPNRNTSARTPSGCLGAREPNNFLSIYQKILEYKGLPPYELEDWTPEEDNLDEVATYDK